MATCTVPSSLIDTTATFNLAAQYLQLFGDIVSDERNSAQVTIEALEDINWPTQTISVAYPSVSSLRAAWVPPVKPETPAFEDDEAPTAFSYNPYLDTDPAYTVSQTFRNQALAQLAAIDIPILSYTGRPAAFAESAPDLSFAPTPYVLPSAPTNAQPTRPTLRQIEIPKLSTLDLSAVITRLDALTQLSPTRLTAPQLRYLETFNAQVTGVLGQVQTQVATFATAYGLNPSAAGAVILEFLTTGNGIPASVETAMRARAQAQVDRDTLIAQDSVTERYAALGYDLPTGAETRALREIYQRGQTAKAELSRDIYIKSAEWVQENRRAGVSAAAAIRQLISTEVLQGIGLAEQVANNFSTLVVQYYQAAQAGEKIYYESVQALIAALNGITEAKVAQLETDRNKIALAELIGKLNDQDTSIYNKEVDAWSKFWDAYETELGAVREIVSIDESRADTIAKRADIWRTQWEAKREEFSAWREQVQAEVAKLQGPDIQARIAETYLRGYGLDVTTAKDESDIQTNRNQQVLQVLEELAATHRADNAAKLARTDAKGRIFATLAQMYAAELSESQALANIDIAAIQANLSQASDKARVDLQAQQIELQQALEQVRIGLQALQVQGNLKTALFGSAAAALNVNVSSSHSGSGSVSSNYSHAITCD